MPSSHIDTVPGLPPYSSQELLSLDVHDPDTANGSTPLSSNQNLPSVHHSANEDAQNDSYTAENGNDLDLGDNSRSHMISRDDCHT